MAWRSRGVRLYEKSKTPTFGHQTVSHRKTHGLGVSIFGPIFQRAFQKRVGALLRLVGLPRAAFKATTKTQLSVVIGVRSGTLVVRNGPGSREGCTF